MNIARGGISTNGVEFAYLEAGSGPLALCLHGFPDSAWTWRHLLPQLAGAGFRAVAPFMRGYAPTAVPDDGRYQTGALATDAVALHDALGGDGEAVLIGHDWGAMAAYGAAVLGHDRWRRVVTMAVPPMGSIGQGLFQYAQLKRSFYMFFFQLPIAEAVVGLDDLAFIEGLWHDWTGAEYDASEDVAHVKDALRDPANLAAAIGYYRAVFDPSRQVPELADAQAATSQPTPQPTLYLHGTDDRALGVELVKGADAFLGRGSEVVFVEGANHFLHLERPDEVNDRVLAFVTA
jgi:pimeloyl-ACP methyl ester carboxylesterase